MELLKASNDLTALIPSASILIASGKTPALPFVRLGPQARPANIRAAGAMRSGLITFSVHAFAGPGMQGQAVIETAERRAARVGNLIDDILKPARYTLTGGTVIRIALSDQQLLPDNDVDRWQWFAQVNARMLAE